MLVMSRSICRSSGEEHQHRINVFCNVNIQSMPTFLYPESKKGVNLFSLKAVTIFNTVCPKSDVTHLR